MKKRRARSAKEQILTIVKILPAIKKDLSDFAIGRIDWWAENLREDINNYKNGGPEPYWEIYGRLINKIFIDDGLPKIYDQKEAKKATGG